MNLAGLGSAPGANSGEDTSVRETIPPPNSSNARDRVRLGSPLPVEDESARPVGGGGVSSTRRYSPGAGSGSEADESSALEELIGTAMPTPPEPDAVRMAGARSSMRPRLSADR
jgi:hypothetical protein